MPFLDLAEELEQLGYGNSLDQRSRGDFMTGYAIDRRPRSSRNRNRVREKKETPRALEKRMDRAWNAQFVPEPYRKEEMKPEDAFEARLRKENLYQQVEMICYGRSEPDSPVTPACMVTEETDGGRAARMDLCVHLFVSRKWSPHKISRLLAVRLGDVVAWLRARNFLVA